MASEGVCVREKREREKINNIYFSPMITFY